jgi:L-2-hydroxyglutarate oxidase LhgO
MEKVGITIIGAGMVGLAIAAELSKKHQDIVLVEKEASFGQGTSSRNSEIIHAGIYYPKDSLKAKLCVEGKHLLYDFCEKNGIPCKRLGKIIAAVDESEVIQLQELEQKAKANGVEDLSWLNERQVKELEPAVKAVSALYSPSTGIIDSHALMKRLEQKTKDNSAVISYGSEVTGIRKKGTGYVIDINGEEALETEILINSAGLYSDKIAALAGIDVEKNHYKLHYCKGEYFSYGKPSFLKHLVYPVPEVDVKSLGIHSVIDLAGGLKFGPSAEYVDVIDYNVNPANKSKFAAAVKNLFPQVEEDDLAPDQAGIRPKLQGPGEGFRDFVIKEETEKGYFGLINLLGIESPGLTACLAIAKYVLGKIERL